MAAGFIGTSIMTYISEITIPQMRGAHLSAFSFFFAIGQLVAAIGLEVLQQVSHSSISINTSPHLRFIHSATDRTVGFP